MWHNVHSQQHTYMSSSYRSTDWVCHIGTLKPLHYYYYYYSSGSRGGSLGSDEPPALRPGVVVENARTGWLYQSSSVRDIFTEIVPQLYTTWHGMLLIYNRDGKGRGRGGKGRDEPPLSKSWIRRCTNTTTATTTTVMQSLLVVCVCVMWNWYVR